jgi:peptidoglycan/LPS O-acetylase OafA/YrhL
VKRLGYARSLDGIRGVGAMAVISAHYFHYVAGGFYSMEVFFALSGFLITTLLLEERDRTGGIALSAFYRRRARRLLPGLFAVLAAYALVSVWHSPVQAFERIAAGGLYATNIVIASGSHLLNGTPFLPFWTLAEEEQFYLLWPLLLLLLLQRRVRESRVAVLLILLFVVSVIHRADLTMAGAAAQRIYIAPDTHSDALVLGCLLAVLRRGGLRIPQAAGWLAIAALVIGSSVISQEVAISYGIAPMAIAATVAVGAALDSGRLGRCLSCRPLVWLGTISYSLYLWHYFVWWLLDYRPFLAMALTFVVATACYYTVERPLRRVSRSRRTPPGEAGPVLAEAGLRPQTLTRVQTG